MWPFSAQRRRISAPHLISDPPRLLALGESGNPHMFGAKRVHWFTQTLIFWVGNSDIDFLNFRHRQVQNFKISNLFKWNWNFAVNFWKYWKHNWKSTKDIATEQQQCIIPIKFHEILLVLWNITNFCKIWQFLVKFCKCLKDLRKILFKWLGQTV
jgi:hypothetical protein